MRSCALVIMDAGPLIKLAIADQLDLLLFFGTKIYIPDEVYFEAVEKYAWEHQAALTPDKIRLKEWVAAQGNKALVFCPETLVGEMAKLKRETGAYSPGAKNHRKNTGELAAHDFFNHREQWGHPGEAALMLIDDGPGIEKLKIHNLDVHILSTYTMLVALECESLIPSAEKIWNDIEVAIPTVHRAAADTSVRGDTEFVSSLRIRAGR